MFYSRTKKIPPREAPLMYASGRQGWNKEAWGGVFHVSLVDISLCLGSWIFSLPVSISPRKEASVWYWLFFPHLFRGQQPLPHHLPLPRHSQGPDIRQSWLSRSASKFTLRSMKPPQSTIILSYICQTVDFNNHLTNICYPSSRNISNQWTRKTWGE